MAPPEPLRAGGTSSRRSVSLVIDDATGIASSSLLDLLRSAGRRTEPGYWDRLLVESDVAHDEFRFAGAAPSVDLGFEGNAHRSVVTFEAPVELTPAKGYRAHCGP